MEFRFLCLGGAARWKQPAAPIKAGGEAHSIYDSIQLSVHLFGSEHVPSIVSGVPITLKELKTAASQPLGSFSYRHGDKVNVSKHLTLSLPV